MKSHLIVCAAGAVLATVATLAAAIDPATAEPLVVTGIPDDPNVRVERVSYRDLNLRDYAGETVLMRRVGRAVKNVCENPHEIHFTDRPCRREAWTGARPQIAAALARARSASGPLSVGAISVVSNRR